MASAPPNEVLRISRKKGAAPTGLIRMQLDKMIKLSKVASRGGVVLSAVSLGVACHQIANTDNTQQKNEILVESLGGIAGGFAAGAAIMIMLTPAGWVAALVVGVGGAVGGYAIGKGFRNLYDTYGRKVDIASATGVARLCRK